jgi:DNA-binding CsgD family transcriptional regulator
MTAVSDLRLIATQAGLNVVGVDSAYGPDESEDDPIDLLVLDASIGLAECMRICSAARDSDLARTIVMLGSQQEDGATAARRAAMEQLSTRELETLRLVAAGESNKRIARRLGIGENTVKTYVKRLFFKLDCRTRSEAAAMFVRSGVA